MKKLVFVLILLPFGIYAQSPGGISGSLRWWLKADAGVLNTALAPAVNGDAVGRWTDQSTIANNATQPTAGLAPIYTTNAINGYPSLRFNGAKFLDGTTAPGISGTTGFDYFMVFKQTSFTPGGTANGSGDYILDRTSASTPLTSFKIVNTDKYFFQQRDDASNIGGPVSSLPVNTSRFVIAHFYRNAGYGVRMNGGNNATSGDNGALTAPILRIGRHATNGTGGIVGDITEMAIYNSPLPAASYSRIQSYLAIKYGITLDQTIATNYVSSAGVVVYPATTTHDLFDNDIAGIAVDTGSGLAQQTSQSQNANSLVSFFSPSPVLSNGQFMLWGHNSPAIGNSSDAPAGYSNRLSRVWRVAKTGTTSTVSVSFDLTGLGISLADPTKFALLIDGDGVFSDAVAWTAGRTIVGNVVTFTTAPIADGEYFSLATDLVPGPGGVGGAVVWLRADKNAYIDAGTTLATANNQPIRQWNNQGQPTYNVAQSTVANQPTFQLSTLNNNPIIRFASGASDSFLDAGSMLIGSTSDLDYSVVVRPSTTANSGILTDFVGGYILDRSAASPSPNPLASLKLVTPTLFGFQKRNDANLNLDGVTTTSTALTVSPQIVEYFRTYGVQYGILYNGGLQSTLVESDGPLTLPNLRIGSSRTGSNTGLNGDIAEVVFYNRTLSSIERNKINTYLAIKYGITLNQSSLTNYLASDGITVLYPTTTTHSAYRYNITGIGQDPVSSLVQTSSLSTNVNPIVGMSTPSNLNDYEFLIWGDNNGSITTPNTVDVGAPVIRRIARAWKVAEKNGDLGTVTITFDLTNVPGAKSAADLRFLIDRNNNGFADNDVAPNATGTLVGQIYTITGINLVDGDNFTLGSTSLSTPLPIELVDFTVENAGGTVLSKWITEAEINNDFFTLQRSKEGREFEVVGTVKGAGDSQGRLNYSLVDKTPYTGLSYYRLKQTDFDKVATYSKIKSVTVGYSEAVVLVVYPNPVEDSKFTIQFNAESQGQALIEIFSVTGQKIYSEIKNDAQQGVNTWPLERSSALTDGVYITRVNAGGKLFVTKMMVR
ncbi:hypothetical protein BH09BAC3_BH09BAC3_30300 [soil metagenome]